MKKINVFATNGDRRDGQAVETADEAESICADILNVRSVYDVVTRESCDGGTVYCYESEEDADKDMDGSRARCGWHLVEVEDADCAE